MAMHELVIISGKGGTGKTSLLASFAVVAPQPVLADCDVDAADLHLVLNPQIERTQEFRSGREAVVLPERCTGCAVCREVCRFGAVSVDGKQDGTPTYRIDPFSCEGCGVCVDLCPHQAIGFPQRVVGEWFVSRTRCGPMVHARLGVAAENSGKLVTRVREEARVVAGGEGRSLILVDGPPGIGCPVIASITGASAVLVVTEPTVAGEHDLERVLELTRHFEVTAAVCVNKWDLNPEMTRRVEERARGLGASVSPRVSYDPVFTRAQIESRTVAEAGGKAAREIEAVWEAVMPRRS